MNRGFVPWVFNHLPEKCPCYNCNKRNAECHGNCEEFKKWQDSKPKVKKNGFFKEGYYK